EGGHVVEVGGADAGVEIGRQGVEAGIREAAGEIEDVLDRTERLVDDDDAAAGAGGLWARQVGVDGRAVALERDLLGLDARQIGDFAGDWHCGPPWGWVVIESLVAWSRSMRPSSVVLL